MILVDRTSNGRPGVLESKNSLDIVSNQFLPSVLISFVTIQKQYAFETNLSRN